MKMRARLISFLGLLSLILAFTAGNISAQKETAVERQTVSEGYGAGKILVGYSTDADVINEYGDDNRIITHMEYSIEIVYEKLGLSFYYCQTDPAKEIFNITIKAPFKAVTTKGVILGESTKKDVELLYADHPLEFGTRYKGIEFYYSKGVVDKIDIFEADRLRQCHVLPTKQH